MADKNTMMSFRLSAQNANTLANLAKELHISKSRIVNDLLDRHLQASQNLKPLKAAQEAINKTHRTIKVALSEKEYLALKAAVKNSITSSVPKLIKLHALNMIYDSKILDSKEIEALSLTRAELNKIGSNINQIARAINTQNDYKADTKLFTALENLNTTLTQLSTDIKNLCATSQGLLQ